MFRKIFYLLIAIVICGHLEAKSLTQIFTRGRLHVLNKELIDATENLERAQKKVTEIKESIAREEIVQIKYDLVQFQKEIALYSTKTLDEKRHLFSEQRKMLASIRDTSDLHAKQAEDLLEQILGLITQLTNP